MAIFGHAGAARDRDAARRLGGVARPALANAACGALRQPIAALLCAALPSPQASPAKGADRLSQQPAGAGLVHRCVAFL
jgi:hypothetical protein